MHSRLGFRKRSTGFAASSRKGAAAAAVTALTVAAFVALVGAGPASSSGAAPAHPTAPPITVPMAGPGWVTFPLPAGVNAAQTHQHLVQGHSDGFTCSFASQVTVSPGFAGQEDDEVALNPNTCQAVVASGPIQASSVSSDAPSPALAATPYSVCNCTESAGYIKTWWTDPISATVTSLRDDIDWITYQGCNDFYDPRHAQTYLWETGWISDYQNNYTHLSCGAAISNSDALMENGSFPACAVTFETAYTHYNYNHEAAGKANGDLVIAQNDYASSTFSICVNLLSWHEAYGFETPYG